MTSYSPRIDITGVRGTRRALLADRAYVELRDRIVTLRIPPGAPIDEDALGRELEMGRTPVREAIKRLEHESLVTVFPRRGTFASEIHITDLNHTSEVRIVLEGLAASRAAERITPSQRSELEGLLADVAHSNARDEVDALIALEAAVHRFIYRCAGNPYLEETLTRYLNLSLRIWQLVIDRLPDLPGAVHDQEEILRAIGAGEAEQARVLMTEHVAASERRIRTVL